MAIRSEESRRAILEATMKLLEDSGPAGFTVQKLSIERIARVDLRQRGHMLPERVDRGHILAHRSASDMVVQESIDNHGNLARPPPVDGGLADAGLAGNALYRERLHRESGGP